MQGGNQVHNYEYRITVGKLQVRVGEGAGLGSLAAGRATEAVAVSLVEPSPKLSADSAYLRLQRPENLLRWDLTVAPGSTGEKAATWPISSSSSTRVMWPSPTSRRIRDWADQKASAPPA